MFWYSLIFVFTFLFAYAKGLQGLDEVCLECICQGSTNCDLGQSCSTPFDGTYFCGHFVISYAYWADAGKKVVGNDHPEHKGTFENCVKDLQCSAETVQAYMGRFKQDCNNDGKIDCEDYVRIHGLGGYGCRDPSFVHKDLYKNYKACINSKK